MSHPDDPFERRELELELENFSGVAQDFSVCRNDFQRSL